MRRILPFIALALAVAGVANAAEFRLRRGSPGVRPSGADNVAPVWQTAASLGGFFAGAGASIALSATDPGDTVTYSLTGSPPAGLSISGTNLAVSAWPASSGSVTVRATDSFGATADRTFSFTISLAASCAAIKATAPLSGSGAYTIDPDGAGSGTSFSVYCDMTSDGGGWTLAAKLTEELPCNQAIQGGSGPEYAICLAATWDYEDVKWTDATVLNSGTVDLSNQNAKYRAYNEMAVTQIRYGPTNNLPGNTILTKSTSNLRALFSGPLNQSATVTRYVTGVWQKVGDATNISDSFHNVNRWTDCGCGAGSARLGAGVCNGVCTGTTAAGYGVGMIVSHRLDGSTIKNTYGNHTALGAGLVAIWIK